jgi:hypothetical protein
MLHVLIMQERLRLGFEGNLQPKESEILELTAAAI